MAPSRVFRYRHLGDVLKKKGRNYLLNAPQSHRALLDLLHSPLGILVLAMSIIEVSGTPPEMPFADHIGRYPADDIAHCLQELSKREAIKGYFNLLSPQRLSELIVQCGCDLTPYSQSYRAQRRC